jgi:hypothetical protein
VVATELDELVFKRREDRIKGVAGGLLRGMSLIELDGFFGRHAGV